MKRIWTYRLGVIFLLLSGWMLGASAQQSPQFFPYAHNTLDWYTIETPHFLVHFHMDEAGNGSSRTAQAVARIAEEIYGPITALYQHEPDTKVSFILKDYEDYSNGAAYFFDNMIEIWAPSLQSPLRGDHPWLRNVITHEFTHIIQVQKTLKAPRHRPIWYLQWLEYEDVRRPDVLYGYPNVIATYPIAMMNNPAWLAEGTAQYQRAQLHYDQWDTHRDMLLRTRILSGTEFSLSEMGGFYSKTSLGRESVYNHGFAFTRYLANTYGEDILREISAALGQFSNWNFDQAMADLVDKSGTAVHADWIATLRDQYAAQTSALQPHLTEVEPVESEGFFNFYPRWSPDGTRLAYVSNRGEDFSSTSLYIHDMATDVAQEISLGGSGAGGYVCSLGERILGLVGGGFNWHPSGEKIIFSRTKDTAAGYLYADLYELTLATKEITRLTTHARASSPAYTPDGQAVIFIVQDDGSTNLHRLDLASGAITALTHFDDGTQVSDPVMHPAGEWVYFTLSGGAQARDIYRVRLTGGAYESVHETNADERTPTFDPRGDWLYFSSDASGIFNVYRKRISGGAPERLTTVLGGAFMPHIRTDQTLAFSEYHADGYKIKTLENPEVVSQDILYKTPAILGKQRASAINQSAIDWAKLNDQIDTDLQGYTGALKAEVEETGSVPIHNTAGDSLYAITPYNSTFTSFSFFPVLRYDHYARTPATAIEAERGKRFYQYSGLRSIKTGVYMVSREVLPGLNFFGGILAAPASADAGSVTDFFSPSRLFDLERDLFLLLDYQKGTLFPSKRWSPQISLEFYNITRNVESGLAIEEFPCTACYPETTFADIKYSLWEAGIYARSKVNRSLLLELGFRYSPYTVKTEQFFSKEFNQTIGSSSEQYYLGSVLGVTAYYEALLPKRHGDAFPEGLKFTARFTHEPGRLLDRFDIDSGTLVPIYQSFKNWRLDLDARYAWRLGQRGHGPHGLSVRLKGSTVLGGEVDSFFDDYVGGLIGARGYPFYALGGNEVLWGQIAYTFPLALDLNRQFLFLHLDKLYARVYFDAAMAWSGAWPGLGALRKDAGLELRLGLGSFYLFPTALFVSGTYGFDTFDLPLRDGFVTVDGAQTVQYGQELLWHFGLLFNFDL